MTTTAWTGLGGYGIKPRHCLQAASFPIAEELVNPELDILPVLFTVMARQYPGCDFAFTWADGVTFFREGLVAAKGYLVPELSRVGSPGGSPSTREATRPG